MLVRPVQERERGTESPRGKVPVWSILLNCLDDFLWTPKSVHMPSATREPSVKAVREGGGVRNRDKQHRSRLANAAHFAESWRQAVKVLHAVIGDDGAKCMITER